ncbi:uncharacterized protein V6R79_005161 [Siganus canaliculatus]
MAPVRDRKKDDRYPTKIFSGELLLMGANIGQNIEQVLMQLQTIKQISFEFTERGIVNCESAVIKWKTLKPRNPRVHLVGKHQTQKHWGFTVGFIQFSEETSSWLE